MSGGWLGFGGRTRNSQPAQQPATSETQSEAIEDAQVAMHRTQTQTHALHHHHHQQQHHHKPPRLSRISSYIGLGGAAKSHSPTTPEFTTERSESMKSVTFGFDSEALRRKNENDVFYNGVDFTWHNPSLKQMIETVSCEMMKNGSSTPIPRHLNGWIASILEEVSHQYCELRDLRAQYAVLQGTRQKELEEFSAMSNEWEQRESGFRAEINRLEHIISDTQQGAESVLLVRAESVVNRNDGRAFRAKLDRLSRSEDDDVTLDRSHDYLDEQANRNSIALSSGNAGLTMDPSPYKTLRAASRFVDPNSVVYLSQQLRYTPTKRRPKVEPDLGAKMVAARISLALTGKPPAPSIKGNTSTGNSDRSSSSSSSEKVSSSSSLITQGLLAGDMAHGQTTPRTSPNKDERFHGRLDKGPAKCDVLDTIREMAAQNGGLPDDAIDDESSYATTPHFCQHKRAFSFSAGDDGTDAPDRLLKAQPASSQRPEQTMEEDRPPSSQLDGPAQDRGSAAADNTLNHQQSETSESSDDWVSNHNRSSTPRSTRHDHVTDAFKTEATTANDRNRNGSSGMVQMTEVMVLQREAVANLLWISPTKKVQERRVPRISQATTADEVQQHGLVNLDHGNGHGRAQLSDALALTTLARPTCGLAQQEARGNIQGPTGGRRLPSQDAAAAATNTLRRSTTEKINPRGLQARRKRGRP